jgi:hypothetical protein
MEHIALIFWADEISKRETSFEQEEGRTSGYLLDLLYSSTLKTDTK